MRKLFSEFLGTALLLATVIGSGIMGETLSGGNVAVALLANAIAGGTGEPVTAWPTDLAPLSKGQLMTLQASLNQLGYDAGPVDGIMGSRTRGALQQFQKARGFVADGYPTLEMLAYVQAAVNPQATSYVPNSG